MAEAVESLVANEVNLEETLNAIADIFSDSETEFEKKKADLRIVRNHSLQAASRNEIFKYLAATELTMEENVESLRRTVLDSIRNDSQRDNSATDTHWPAFQTAYSEHYAASHDAVMANPEREAKIKNILSSGKWPLVNAVLRTNILPARLRSDLETLDREVRQGSCNADLNEILSIRPTCGCRFSLRHSKRLNAQADELEAAVSGAVTAIRDRVLVQPRGDDASGSFERLAAKLDGNSALNAEDILSVIGLIEKESMPTDAPDVIAVNNQWSQALPIAEVYATVDT